MSTDPFEGLGARLRAARLERGLRQDEVAGVLGVHTKTISRWENGAQYPRLLHLNRMIDLYEADPICVYFGDTEVNARSTGTGRRDSAPDRRPSPQTSVATAARVRIETFLMELREAGYAPSEVQAVRRLLEQPKFFGLGQTTSRFVKPAENTLIMLERAIADLRKVLQRQHREGK